MVGPVTGINEYDLVDELGQLSTCDVSEESDSTLAAWATGWTGMTVGGAGSGVSRDVGVKDGAGVTVCRGMSVAGAVPLAIVTGMLVTSTARVTSTIRGVAVGMACRVARTASRISSGSGWRGTSRVRMPTITPASARPSRMRLYINYDNDAVGRFGSRYRRRFGLPEDWLGVQCRVASWSRGRISR